MAFKLVTVVLVLVMVSLGVLHVEGECTVRGHGDLTTFSGEAVSPAFLLPCKARATRVTCQGYEIRVTPGMTYDEGFRLFVGTAWIRISKGGYFWDGRTTSDHLSRHFKNSSKDLFTVKHENMAGADFTIVQKEDAEEHSASISVSGAPFLVTYYGYRNKKDFRERSGFKIDCNGAVYSEKSNYPDSFCGNDTSPSALEIHGKELGFKRGEEKKILLFDTLSDETVTQTDENCVKAMVVFGNCGGLAKKRKAINTCIRLLASRGSRKCITGSFGISQPITTFKSCLQYRCNGNVDMCHEVQDATENCRRPLFRNCPVTS
ncbi:uncharacterized protein LOC143277909 [Babylonia areolata]|uniref:uncharacterized protein LOC143277909 n=1 Tax=Babylonia areolata TaxID=304850 RepID=UPI003FD68B3D